MRCDTCQKDAPVVMRVVVAKDYNRALARPIYNCEDCFEKKEHRKTLRVEGSGLSPQPRAQS